MGKDSRAGCQLKGTLAAENSSLGGGTCESQGFKESPTTAHAPCPIGPHETCVKVKLLRISREQLQSIKPQEHDPSECGFGGSELRDCIGLRPMNLAHLRRTNHIQNLVGEILAWSLW